MPDENKKKQLKRKFISLEDKIQILNRLNDGEKPSSVGKSLNLNEATIRTIKKNENKIRKSVVDGCSLDAKRVARVRDIDMIRMEHVLMIWFEDCIDKKIPLSGNVIRQQALRIYKRLKEIGHSTAEQQNQSFTASKGWFEKLKKRFSLHNIKFQGEQEFIDKPTSNALIEDNFENINNESVPNLSLNDVQKGIDMAKKLELYFIEKDPSVVRSGKFKRELQSCLAPYQELLAQLQCQKTSMCINNPVKLNNEDIKNVENFSPIKKERVTPTVGLDNSDDEN